MAKTKTIKLLALVLLLPLLGLGCKGSGTVSKDSLEPVTLKYWRVFDEPSDFTDTIAAFKQIYPHINVTVRKLRIEEYEDAIVRALAEGNGPDIISVHATALKQYQNLLSPMPASVTLPATIIGSNNKSSVVLQTTKLPSSQDVRASYIDTVAADVTLGGQLYGLPLSVDTMVLYYNRQLLNQANVPAAPRTWEELKEAVKALTTQDSNGNIIQSGAALGGARNINRAPDILAALMMQNGTDMTRNNQVAFHQVPASLTESGVVPGRDALRFYTDFASPAKEVYTWNENLPESLDAFANQQVAFFFGYAYHLPLIRSLAPGIDLGLTKLPQIATTGRQVNVANYWFEGVTKQSAHRDEAWGFLQFATSEAGVGAFLAKSGKPTALRNLIAAQRQSPELAPFADQLLTAQNWYHGGNAAAMEEALRTAVERVIAGALEPDAAINQAAQSVSLTY